MAVAVTVVQRAAVGAMAVSREEKIMGQGHTKDLVQLEVASQMDTTTEEDVKKTNEDAARHFSKLCFLCSLLS